MLVYRLEDEAGKGPWNGGRRSDEFYRANRREIDRFYTWTTQDKHPGPYEDGLAHVFRPSRHKFGFGTAEQVKEWFNDPLRHALDRHGYHLSTYLVPDEEVHVGGHQVIFDPARAKLVSTSPVGAL